MNNKRGPAKNRYIFWASITISIVLALILFVNLTDAGQFLSISNKTFISTWSLRLPISALATLTLVISWLSYFGKEKPVSNRVFISFNVAWLVLLSTGLLLNSFVLFKPQADPDRVTYLTFPEADKLFDYGDDVVVLIVNGRSAAYPRSQIWEPHIVGLSTDEEKISFTFCSLSNLGIAYSPGSGKDYLDLGVVGQAKNNLVMYNRHTGDAIQQITGRNQSTNELLDMRPTLRMTYGNYKRAFPNGRVFSNSVAKSIPRKVLSGIFFSFYRYFMMKEDLAFPYDYKNTLLPGKQQVYALSINGDAVAYTADFLINRDGPVNVSIGGKHVVLVYSKEFETISAFFSEKPVTSVDFYGNSNVGQLRRVESFRSKVYWGVWQHYFPDTALNRT